ncbi:hypothetical protein, partial [Vibrio coralliilyticus]|uniref:hypothetical protein n=1 Tax=Vibrio coralliilyticus TaxID=190893 RepID=UPI000570799C
YKAKLSTMLSLSYDNLSHKHHFSLCQFSDNNVVPSHAPPTMLTLSNDNIESSHHLNISQ